MVSSTEKGNISFNEATLAVIVMGACSNLWWNQHELNHKTVPKSPRAMLQDLQNIEKVFIKKFNKKAKVNKSKASTTPKADDRCVPRKCVNGEVALVDQPPIKGGLPSIANGAMLMVTPSLCTIP